MGTLCWYPPVTLAQAIDTRIEPDPNRTGSIRSHGNEDRTGLESVELCRVPGASEVLDGDLVADRDVSGDDRGSEATRGRPYRGVRG